MHSHHALCPVICANCDINGVAKWQKNGSVSLREVVAVELNLIWLNGLAVILPPCCLSAL